MSRWFRFYDTTLDDPKVQRLSDKLYRAWTQVLCIASRYEGKLPPQADMAFLMRRTEKEIKAILIALQDTGLIDGSFSDGSAIPHNWDGRQYISDSSSERVKRHREKRAAAGLLAQWQPSESVRQEVYSRDKFCCVYCSSGKDLTIDHKTPELRGGTNDLSNLQTACRVCNASKRDLTHEEFLQRSQNSDETLLKRHLEHPQNTDNRTEIPLPNGKGVDLPILEVPVIETPEFKLYRRGKEILGSSSGGQIKRLRAAVGGDVALARAALETASTKHDPAEYIGGVIRSRNRESYGGAADDLIT